MVRALQDRGIVPGVVLSSTALRARTTAEAIAGGLGFDPARIQLEAGLYLAADRVILRQIQGLDETADTAFLFGHNPGMHEAVNQLNAEGGIDDFPTLAVARFEFDLDHWGQIEWRSGLLVELIIPRDLTV